MNMLKMKSETPIAHQCNSKYTGFTFDGCYFYFLCPEECRVIKCDSCFCEIDCFITEKPYQLACYDYKEECFWALSQMECHKIFKLNCCFEEIECMILCADTASESEIQGISYDCQGDCLILAFINCIVSVDKVDYPKQKVIRRINCGVNQDVLCISPSYIVTTAEAGEQTICIYGGDNKLKNKFEVPSEYFVISILFYPCEAACEKKDICVILAIKNSHRMCVMEWDLNCYAMDIDCCNYCICHKEERKNPCLDSTHSCDDILESIALIETAIAHILNAEGEKLQKVIASSKDVDKILCANQAVKKMVVDITHLEIMLYDKLATVSEICQSCEKSCQKPCQKPCTKGCERTERQE